MKLFGTKAAPVKTQPEPRKARKPKATEAPEFVTRERFDAVVDALLELIAEAACADTSGGFAEALPPYRFARHADSPVGKRAQTALRTVQAADQHVENERARHRRYG